ncbi:MAG: hypothetical protein LLF96_10285 [Eubacteriales bacterium]|nr:hypothetical protein [Eubacteriales bacterium]
MKRKLLLAALLLLTALLLGGTALAATDPIVCSMEVSPSTLTEPGVVSVTITVTNSGATDMQEPLTLYSPTSEVVTDFGDKGSVTLKAGEVKTWTGTWDVNQHTLDNKQIVYFVKYALIDENGTRQVKSQPIRGKLEVAEAKTDIDIKRTISPGTARDGQTVNIVYDIVNTGTVSLKNVKLKESKDISTKEVSVADELKAGDAAQVKFPVTMGKKNLTSSATITYTAGSSSEKLTKTVDEQVILYGEAAMTAKLTASAKGAAINGTVTLSLELKNTGTVDYTGVRVTDTTLGDVFTDQKVPAGETLKLDKEITLTETTAYQFTVTAVDNTGTEVTLNTDALTLTAIDPSKVVHLTLVAAADRTEVYTQPGIVRFTITVANDSEVEAKEVTIYEAKTAIYTFASIPAGATRTLTRDAALSMAGKYLFTAEATDALDTINTFASNEIQIAFSIPTAAPVTPTPPAVPTAEPTYAQVTYVPISNSSVGAVPKLIRAFFYPLMFVSGILLLGAAVLLAIATKKRMDEKRASEAALDHLDRAKRRDYVAPNEEADEPAQDAGTDQQPISTADETPGMGAGSATGLNEEELPHMKYVRNAYQRSEAAPEPAFGRDVAEPVTSAPDGEEGGREEPSAQEGEPATHADSGDEEKPAGSKPAGRGKNTGKPGTLADELRAYRERDVYFHEPIKAEDDGYTRDGVPAAHVEKANGAKERRPAGHRSRRADAEHEKEP